MKERLELSRGLLQGFTALCRILVFFTVSIVIINGKGYDVNSYFEIFLKTFDYNITLHEVKNILSEENSDVTVQENNIGIITVNSSVMLILLLIHLTAAFITYSGGKLS